MMKAQKDKSKEAHKVQTKISFGFIKKPVFYIPASIFSGIVVVGLGAVLIMNPGIAKGEFDFQSLYDMVMHHETRLNDLDKKTDNTQAQTNTNTNDIKSIQGSTTSSTTGGTSGTTSSGSSGSSSSTGTSGAVTPPAVTTPTEDPRTVYWDTEKHGRYSWYDLVNRQTIQIEQAQEKWLTDGTKCYFGGVNVGDAVTGYKSYSDIPGLIPYAGYTNSAWPSIPATTINSISFVFDMRGRGCSAHPDFVVVRFTRWDPNGNSATNSYSPGDWTLMW